MNQLEKQRRESIKPSMASLTSGSVYVKTNSNSKLSFLDYCENDVTLLITSFKYFFRNRKMLRNLTFTLDLSAAIVTRYGLSFT